VAVRATFRDREGRAIDDGLALFFPAPASYTGEDVLELQGHGGPVVAAMLLARCVELGARVADPGEFTKRAFLNDKLDLAQAEAVADVIDAASETAARCALRSLRGEFSAAIHALDAALVELRALIEATLDFPEEEIDPLDRADARGRLDRLLAAVDRALESARQGSLLRTGLRVVLAGEPNVGKSSLLNRLAGEERAIVTSIPGTTRDALRESIQIEGVPLHVIDTAGLRAPGDEVERLGIERTWREIEQADVVLQVVDANAGEPAPDPAVPARAPRGVVRMVVHNKIDLSGTPAGAVREQGVVHVRLSAKTGEGIAALRATLLEAAGYHAREEDVFMARARHLGALRCARERLAAAAALFAQPELLAEELRLAHRELQSITGEVSADDLLGEIFSRFCIGK
jgi:tRNA modification GTPase